MRRLVFALSVILLAGVVMHAHPFDFAQGGPSAVEGQQPAPTNLKVLPKTMTRPEVVRIMRSFAMGLGVRCQHCHVGEGNDLTKFDFASDAKPQKEIARKMLAMVMEINNRHLAGVVVPAAPPAADAPPAVAPPAAAPGQPPAQRVTCYTCHRGALKPLTAAPPAEGRGGAR